MRVLVCGGRDYADVDRVFAVLDALHAESPVSVMFLGSVGESQGAERIALLWAKSHGIYSVVIPGTDLRYYGRVDVRSHYLWKLSLAPDIVIVFPGDDETVDLVRQAKKTGVPVREITSGEQL